MYQAIISLIQCDSPSLIVTEDLISRNVFYGPPPSASIPHQYSMTEGAILLILIRTCSMASITMSVEYSNHNSLLAEALLYQQTKHHILHLVLICGTKRHVIFSSRHFHLTSTCVSLPLSHNQWHISNKCLLVHSNKHLLAHIM